MITTTFANPILTEMSYHDGTLTVRLRGKLRSYSGVGQEVAYRLFYSKDPLSVYASEVKGKYKVEVKR